MLHADVSRAGEASKRLTAAVLAHYGAVCWLDLPGCTRRATTKDHVIPVAAGGTDAMDNLRPACHACNSKRRDMAIGGVPGGILVTLYLGPLPRQTAAAARDAAVGEDIVLSPALILEAMTPTQLYAAPAAQQVAQRAFSSAMHQALRQRRPIHVRIAHPVPTLKQLQTWARLRYFTEVIDPGRAEAEREATLAGREALLEVQRWYDRYPEGRASIERAAARRPTTGLAAASGASSPEAVQPSRAW